MTQQRKLAALTLFTLLAGTCTLMIGMVSAQSIPKPSVPEFTVQLVDNSYDVPFTQTIDPYTGQKITHPGHHVENKTIEIKITNQRNDYIIYYSVKMKGHFEENWTTLYSTWNRMKQSDSQYTIFIFKLPSVALDGGRIDFQVEVAAGYWSQGDIIVPGAPRGDVFIGEKSGWSNTQTLSVPANVPLTHTPAPQSSISASTTPVSSNPNVAPSDSQLTWLLVGVVAGLGAIVALLIVVVVFIRGRIRVLELKQNDT